MDQDTQPQPITDRVSITENLSDGTSVATSTNNIGLVFDNHAAFHAGTCLKPGEGLDITQTVTVQISGISFPLTTQFEISAGNNNGILFEETKVLRK